MARSEARQPILDYLIQEYSKPENNKRVNQSLAESIVRWPALKDLFLQNRVIREALATGKAPEFAQKQQESRAFWSSQITDTVHIPFVADNDYVRTGLSGMTAQGEHLPPIDTIAYGIAGLFGHRAQAVLGLAQTAIPDIERIIIEIDKQKSK